MKQKGFASIILLLLLILLAGLGIGGFWLYRIAHFADEKGLAKSVNPYRTSSEEWITYTDSTAMFSIKYPLTLYVVGEGEQTFLEAFDARGYSDHLIEIRVDKAIYRFEKYFNTVDNSPVQGYGDLKLRTYMIDGYKAVEYGYDEVGKEKEIKEQTKAEESGASVGMIYFPKGLIINKNGTIIGVSTNSYYGDFKETFDKILSTFRFE